MIDTQYTRYRWFVLLILSVVSMATVANIVAPATMIGEIARTSGLSMGAAAIAAMGMIDLSTGLSGLIGGFCADRFGVGKVWMVAFILLIIGSLLIPLYGDSFVGLSVIRFLHGCGAGPIIATSPLVAAQWFPHKDRGMIIGVQGTMVSVGAAASLMFVPRVFQASGQWQTALAWMALFSLAGLLMAMLLAVGRQPAPMKGPKPPPPGARGLGFSELRTLLMQPATLAAIGCGFFFSWEVRAFNDLIPNYLAIAQPNGLGLGPIAAGDTMVLVQIAFAVGPLLGGFLADRVFGGRPRPLVIGGFLISAVACYALGLPQTGRDYGLLVAALSLTGLAMSVTSPQVMTFIVKNYPEHMIGKLGGLIMGCSILGGVAGVSACSFALHLSGGQYSSTILLIAAAPVLGALAGVFLVRRGDAPAGRSVSAPLTEMN